MIKDKDYPTLYHKHFVQKYGKYPIRDQYLKTSTKQTINYLTGLIICNHLTDKIPEQLKKSKKKPHKKESQQQHLIHIHKTDGNGTAKEISCKYNLTVDGRVVISQL